MILGFFGSNFAQCFVGGATFQLGFVLFCSYSSIHITLIKKTMKSTFVQCFPIIKSELNAVNGIFFLLGFVLA